MVLSSPCELTIVLANISREIRVTHSLVSDRNNTSKDISFCEESYNLYIYIIKATYQETDLLIDNRLFCVQLATVFLTVRLVRVAASCRPIPMRLLRSFVAATCLLPPDAAAFVLFAFGKRFHKQGCMYRTVTKESPTSIPYS